MIFSGKTTAGLAFQMHRGSSLVVIRWCISWSDGATAVVTLAWKDRGDRIDEVYTAHCLREHGGSR